MEKSHLHPIMFTGTGSDVGKSVVAAAFCRIFLQDGYRPAPFKAQNMALNSFATADGLEIGRAQAVQAEAAGVPCHTDMNPLLLKPQSDHTSQVVLNGRPIGTRSASEYFRKEGREALRAEVCAAFDRLADRYTPVVMEGAGSMTELNLRDVDLVNLPMAAHAGADVILVADIDRGGVFASVYGSIALLRPEERKMVKGVLINKFRGDLKLFESGVKMIEELCGVPVLGVIPYYKDIYIEEEDSVDLARKSMTAERGRVNIAVVLLRHLSNFTDFNVLERDPRVHLFYTSNTAEIAKADIIILPGSKSTVDDLCELRRNGVAQAIIRARHDGATVLGICGGYQMMGREVLDPDHVEGDIEHIPGLGLLPISTTMTAEKTTRQIKFQGPTPTLPERSSPSPTLPKGRENCGESPANNDTTALPPLREGRGGATPFREGQGGASSWGDAYEIHMGSTSILPPLGEGRGEASPLCLLSDGSTDGCIVDNRCMGTYLHGILDNQQFIDFILEPFGSKIKEAAKPFDYVTFKNEQYDKLADHVRRNVNMELLYKILKGEQ